MLAPNRQNRSHVQAAILASTCLVREDQCLSNTGTCHTFLHRGIRTAPGHSPVTCRGPGGQSRSLSSVTGASAYPLSRLPFSYGDGVVGRVGRQAFSLSRIKMSTIFCQLILSPAHNISPIFGAVCSIPYFPNVNAKRAYSGKSSGHRPTGSPRRWW